MPSLTLHVIGVSHPSRAAEAALRLKGLDFERVELAPGEHNARMEELYGEGRRTVPGLLVDGERVHGSVAIMRRLEELAPEPRLYPADRADAVREAEEWSDRELQDLGRRIPWGALGFSPWALGRLAGGGDLDGPGTDFAMKFTRAAWKYHGITAQRLAEDLAALPAMLDHVDSLIADGVIGGETPNAADLQIGSTLAAISTVADVRPLIEDRPCASLRTTVDGYTGEIPAGAFPAGWLAPA